MQPIDLMLAVLCDYGGRVRGKGYPVRDAEKFLHKGIGLAPTNLMITSFGEIVNSPWGPRGDLLMMPDASTETVIEHGADRPAERFILCSLTTLDGTPWACCPRSWLTRGLAALEAEFGVRLLAAFEHEFHYSGVPEQGGNAYGLGAWRAQGDFLARVMGALDAAGIGPQMAMPEYGVGQFEVTNDPALGLRAADDAVRLREIVRAIAAARGERACFAPVMGAGKVGNGVHVHFSLQNLDGAPVSYDPARAGGMSPLMSRFTAGILRHMPDFLPLTAAASVSYERLQPNRWSACWNNLSQQDREAGVRICPIEGTSPERSYNLEYRAADASANPYLVLGALVWAGLSGLRDEAAQATVSTGDPALLTPDEIAARGLVRLPGDLETALARMEASAALHDWMGAEFLAAYAMNKRSELSLIAGLTLDQQVARYVEVF